MLETIRWAILEEYTRVTKKKQGICFYASFQKNKGLH